MKILYFCIIIFKSANTTQHTYNFWNLFTRKVITSLTSFEDDTGMIRWRGSCSTWDKTYSQANTIYYIYLSQKLLIQLSIYHGNNVWNNVVTSKCNIWVATPIKFKHLVAVPMNWGANFYKIFYKEINNKLS